MNLEGRTIILGISGGIAAYKTVDLVSQLKKMGADVHVVATDNALKFVSPLSLQVMSGNKVHTKQSFDQRLIDEANRLEDVPSINVNSEIDHIELADEADLILIAPATANTIAKLVTGISDDILFDLVLATRAPVVVAPAMNTNMWKHTTTQRNVDVLKESLGYHFVEPESGELACGHIGQGRLAELEVLVDKVAEICSTLKKKPKRRKATSTTNQQSRNQNAALEKLGDGSFSFDARQALIDEDEDEPNPNLALIKSKKLIITVGATREKIDPVRFITNKSSGKMGFALAREALKHGAEVHLISTIDNSEAWVNDIKFKKVETHQQMYEAICNEFIKSSPYGKPADALIMVAAVADYRPRVRAEQKIKKQSDTGSQELDGIIDMINEANEKAGDLTIQLEKTPDILQDLSSLKQANQVMVGFSVETEDLIENSRTKIQEKGLDFIVANSPASFGADEAEVSIIASDTKAERIPMITSMPKESKHKIAKKVLEYLGLCLESMPATVK